MPFQITRGAFYKTQQTQKEPQLVLEIEGVDTKYGVSTIRKYVRIGDPGLLIGNDWVIGGLNDVEDQSDLITFGGSGGGTTPEIKQQLEMDKGGVSSVTNVKVSLVDLDGEATELISPGVVVTDILGRKAKLWLGFADTAFPEDYLPIFYGIIDDVDSGAGIVNLSVSHPDQLKRQSIFRKAQNQLNGAINNAVTTITVDDTTDFLAKVLGPDGVTYDSAIEFCIKIDDEIIRYDNKTGTTFTGCTRGYENTIAASHDDDADVESFYIIQENAVLMALKLMLSGRNGSYASETATAAVRVDPTPTDVDNAIFFFGVDVAEKYGVAEGSYVSTAGFTNGANNFTARIVQDVVKTNDGSYVTVDGAALIVETAAAASVSFRSQYDTLGEGLAMMPDQVDVEQHQYLYSLFLSSNPVYRHYLKDSINGKEFLEDKVYFPAGCVSVPRKGRSSIKYLSPPLPIDVVPILNRSKICNPDKLKVRRSIGKNFFNTVIVKYDPDSLEEKYLGGRIVVSATSKTQIPVGNRALTIEADGLRKNLQGNTWTTQLSNRLLNRYKFGAELFPDVKVLYGDGYNLEIADVVVLDGDALQQSDITTGERGLVPRLVEIINKRMNIKTGEIRLDLLDTNFDTQARYGLISPSSYVRSASSASTFQIESSFASVYDLDEWRKWKRYEGATIRVHSTDNNWVRNDTGVITNISGNTVTLDAPLSFTPQPGDIMELSDYNDATDTIKLIYVFMRDTDPFDDGKNRYQMI